MNIYLCISYYFEMTARGSIWQGCGAGTGPGDKYPPGIPVIAISFLLTNGGTKCSRFFNRASGMDFWFRSGVALVFIAAGLYLTFTVYRFGIW